ncbi:MAG TPA: ABC transporter permease [Devosiaceae bacterium]|nr:ABC transporter permease [Devosiaceae bacterium]
MTARFFLTKLLRGLVTLFLAVTFVFVVLRLSGDPVQRMVSDDLPASVIDSYRQLWGLDKSLPEQFVRYLLAISHGDFGVSFRDGRPALEVVVERIPATLELGLAGFAITLLLGLPAGIIAALRRGTWIDRATMGFTILGHSLPNFFFGILMIFLFSMTLRWLPSSGTGSIWHLIMPAVTLGTGAAGTIARFTRSSLLEVLHQPFMRTAWAKGLSHRARVMRHALPNAAIPVVTVVGLRLGGLIGGAVVLEPVFSWPGVGMLLVNSVSMRDLAVVQAIVLLIAFTMVIVNLAVDLTYGWLDPRIETYRTKGAS